MEMPDMKPGFFSSFAARKDWTWYDWHTEIFKLRTPKLKYLLTLNIPQACKDAIVHVLEDRKQYTIEPDGAGHGAYRVINLPDGTRINLDLRLAK